MNLDQFIVDLKNLEYSEIDRGTIRIVLNMEAKAEKWSFIVKLLISDKVGLLTTNYFIKKLMTLRKLMKKNRGYQILDSEKKLVYFKEYPYDKIQYLRGI
ncbi:TPA_asm: hypothetical protein ES702_05908 [Lokiarchaeia virus SkuldV3]|uniref:Uncharacterized protein n=1 Tax=Lokiarchaeia virus SkuldV3 TaxID=2983915 RepID=A0A9N7AAP1_9VIRU|nr:hypothetical protein QKT74_gp05 [Lokiarchaeia virus SkuldV3]DAZ90945.1 TPA_asm: hypothetical protein ES702_05908 [Lokiarchaeia virus SkuldV3]